jgi:HAD superfamily hydrolase (TIGR01484 family)
MLSISPDNRNNIAFSRLLPNEINIKMVASDLDGTLLAGTKKARNTVMNQNCVSVYATARQLERVTPLIEKGTLKLPDFLITDEGARMFERVNNCLRELTLWSEKAKHKYNPKVVTEVMDDIAKEKIAKEYNAFDSDIYKWFFIAPGVNCRKFLANVRKRLEARGVRAKLSLRKFPQKNMTLKGLQKYYTKEKALEIKEAFRHMQQPDGSAQVIVISADTEKGKAIEYIRKKLKLTKDDVLAAGDAIADFSMAKQGYNFAVIRSNETDALEKALLKLKDQTRIYYPKAKGANGIKEVWL